MILILTSGPDPHVDAVVPYLEELSAPWFLFDPTDFPLRSKLILRHGPSGRSARLEVGDRSLDLEAVRVVWSRRPRPPSTQLDEIDERTARFADHECAELLQSVWDSLNAAWFPAPRWHIQRVQPKHWQLAVAAELGFTLPETLVTNDPDAFIDFYQDHGHASGHRIISKLHGSGFPRAFGGELLRYTEVVGQRDVAALRSITTGPMVFQSEIPKSVEVRVTVVGDQAFAVEIHSQTTRRTKTDWRRYDDERTPHESTDLPPDLANRCVALCKRMGLRFGAIDLIVRPDGETVFLELNPNGQYLWLERATGVDLSRVVAEELASLLRVPSPAADSA